MQTYGQSINKALDDLLKYDKKIILLGEDIRDPYGGAFKITRSLSNKYPDQVINTPISEGAITGIATGLALNEFKPILEIMFGDFLTLCCDQIINHASKFPWMYNDKIKVPLVIRTPMGGYRGYGPTHSQTIEKLFLGTPGIEIVAPSLFHNPGELLRECVKEEKLILYVENKLSYPRKLKEGENTNKLAKKTIGNGYDQTILFSYDDENVDVTVLCYGGMASLVEEATKELFVEEEISCEVVIPSCIKPLSVAPIINSVHKSGRLVVVEEGTLENGWGAEVAAKIQELSFKSLESPITRVAAKDLPIANTKSIENETLPQKDDIQKAILDVFNSARDL